LVEAKLGAAWDKLSKGLGRVSKSGKKLINNAYFSCYYQFRFETTLWEDGFGFHLDG
jgi:hypothetical protein